MGVTQWAYTMITRALGVPKKCVSNRNVKNGDAGRRKPVEENDALQQETRFSTDNWCCDFSAKHNGIFRCELGEQPTGATHRDQ